MRYFSESQQYTLAMEDLRAGEITQDEFDTEAERFQDAVDARAEMAHEELMLGED